MQSVFCFFAWEYGYVWEIVVVSKCLKKYTLAVVYTLSLFSGGEWGGGKGAKYR